GHRPHETGQRQGGSTDVAWDRGYYYRVRKVNGRVRREYVGRGPVAEAVAALDAADRERREDHRRQGREDRARSDELAAKVAALDELADLLAAAALAAAGFHRHHRGEWRRRRVRQPDAGEAGTPAG